jgi:hypothetical protein
MANISIPIASMALVATLLVPGIGLPTDIARADDCAAAPTAAAPQGQHWYFRFDHAKRRKCWYLHATMQLLHRPAPQLDSETTSAAPVDSATPQIAAVPPAEAPVAANPPDSTAPAPQIKILSVQKVSAPFAYAAAEDGAAQSAAQTSAAPPDNASTSAVSGGNPTDAANRASRDGESAGRSEASQTAAAAGAFALPKPAEMFFLLAVGLSLVAFLLGIVGKIATRQQRNPGISDHPAIAWNGYRFGAWRIYDHARFEERSVPFIDAVEQHGLGILPEPEWIDPPPLAPSESAPASPQVRHALAAEPSEQSDIELALRVLRQARRQRVA